MLFALFCRSFLWANSRSSSAKSSSSSTSAVTLIKSSRIFCTYSDNEPSSCFIEDACASFVFACIKSATASACDKSILPLRKARFVNSPGSARTVPFFTISPSTFWVTNTPPCDETSATSSPVYELGDLNIEINTSSTILSPSYK